MNKVYLGDSVYMQYEPVPGGRIILTTENGYGPSNSIVLEYEVVEALLLYINKQRGK